MASCKKCKKEIPGRGAVLPLVRGTAKAKSEKENVPAPGRAV